MTLIVEDGTGLADAESYASVTEVDTYHSNRGNSLWATLSTANKEEALRRATDYMIGEYRMKWLGRRVLITQALDWPRVGVVLKDFGGSGGRNGIGSYGLWQISFTIVPPEIKNACAELALRASIFALAEDISPRVLEETVGPIKVKYSEWSSQRIQYRQVDDILRVFLIAGGNSNMAMLQRC
jgi:hypothetical protein